MDNPRKLMFSSRPADRRFPDYSNSLGFWV